MSSDVFWKSPPWRHLIAVPQVNCSMHIGANGVSWLPWKNGWKIKKRKHAKKSSFPCICYILRAIRAGRCRERRCADHIFIQMYFRIHHFVVEFSKISSPPAAKGTLSPLTKILRTFLPARSRGRVIQGDSDAVCSISMPVDFCRHLVGKKTPGNVCHCDSA